MFKVKGCNGLRIKNLEFVAKTPFFFRDNMICAGGEDGKVNNVLKLYLKILC